MFTEADLNSIIERVRLRIFAQLLAVAPYFFPSPKLMAPKYVRNLDQESCPNISAVHESLVVA
jgi:hypothetical protein